jgi:hypothetical protein
MTFLQGHWHLRPRKRLSLLQLNRSIFLLHTASFTVVSHQSPDMYYYGYSSKHDKMSSVWLAWKHACVLPVYLACQLSYVRTSCIR